MRHWEELTVSSWRVNSESDVIKAKKKILLLQKSCVCMGQLNNCPPPWSLQEWQTLWVIIRGTVFIVTWWQKMGEVHMLYAHYKKGWPGGNKLDTSKQWSLEGKQTDWFCAVELAYTQTAEVKRSSETPALMKLPHPYRSIACGWLTAVYKKVQQQRLKLFLS